MRLACVYSNGCKSLVRLIQGKDKAKGKVCIARCRREEALSSLLNPRTGTVYEAGCRGKAAKEVEAQNWIVTAPSRYWGYVRDME